MKAQAKSILFWGTLISGIVFLVAGALQEYLAIWQNGPAGMPQAPNVLSTDSLQITLLLIPEIILFIYVIFRLYNEMENIGRTALAAIGYPLLILATGRLVSFLSIEVFHSSFLMILLFGGALLGPFVLCLIGLSQKDSGTTLISFMIFNAAYVWYTLAMYTGNSGDLPFIHSALFVLPLMLLVVADLVLYSRFKSKKAIQAS